MNCITLTRAISRLQGSPNKHTCICVSAGLYSDASHLKVALEAFFAAYVTMKANVKQLAVEVQKHLKCQPVERQRTAVRSSE
jgi:hypothetical protein